MNWKRLKIIFIVVAIAIPFLACAFCGWIVYWEFNGRYRAFEFLLPIYGGAERISSDFIYNDVQSGFTALYYWSADAVEDIRHYYMSLTRQSEKSDLKVILHENLNDGYAGMSCYSWPTENPECVEVTLIDLRKPNSISLPDILIVRGVSLYQFTPHPQVIESRGGGTLIIFGYYTPEM